jgi:hypothetical protein
MKRYATISVVLNCGDDPMPSDRVLSQAIEVELEGQAVWRGEGRVIAGSWQEPAVVIDSASVRLREVVVP